MLGHSFPTRRSSDLGPPWRRQSYLPYLRYGQAGESGPGRQRRRRSRPRRAVAGRRPARGMDAAGRRRPAVARRPGGPRLPGLRVRPPAGARDRHGGPAGAAAACAAPGRRGPHLGPVRGGAPARFTAAGRRGRRGAGRPGAAQAATAPGPGPGPGRGRADGARAAAARLLRRGDRGRVRRGAHSGPSHHGRIRERRPARAERRGRVRGQRGGRRAAGARTGTGRDGARGVPAGGSHCRRGSAARPEVREPGAGGEPGAAPGGTAHPAGGRGSDAWPRAARRGACAVHGGREAGHRRERQPLPRPATRRVRGVNAGAGPARPDGGRDGSRAWPGRAPRPAPGCPRSRTPRAAAARRTGGTPPRGTRT